ncbi:hypothetical protein [Tenuibacillus multivorans]|uniref:Uncharacterized protein n=1 Tax=Tenuibacillus multivorans TaxID=237069 RepID=A0A1H0B1F3_9BACI|nr:hypothetical protein [Tenuibacillus multivorans]GEL77570.1 hypothetical protein TMU01_18050 [Tenuibacillus multivorans]SDN39484.1 hypothetical protein SAMN05216498_2177 [Tenuibacillus multivorans]
MFKNDEDHDTYFDEESSNNRNLKNKAYGKQLMAGVIILAVFIVGVQIATLPQETESTEEAEESHEEEFEDSTPEPRHNWPEVNSQEELDQHFYDVVPGLEKAEQYGLVDQTKQIIEFQKTDRTMAINKTWYTSEGIYFIYSTKLNEEDLKGDGSFFLSVYHSEFGDSLMLPFNSVPGTVQLDDRIFRVTKIQPVENEDGQPLEEVNGEFAFDFELNFMGRHYVSEDQEIALSYSFEDEQQ